MSIKQPLVVPHDGVPGNTCPAGQYETSLGDVNAAQGAAASKVSSQTRSRKRRENAERLLTTKALRHIKKSNAKDPRSGTPEEASTEALERMQYMELDDLYQDRLFQNQLVAIIETERSSTKWTAKDKMKAVMSYLITASTWQAGELTGIPVSTIKLWRTESAWWPKALEYARSAKKEALVSKLGEIVDLSHKAVVDRLQHGDYKYDSKTGDQYRLPVSAKDAMLIADKAQDKGMVLRGEATNITEKRQTQDSLLRTIADKLEEAIKKADAKVLEGIVISRE